MDEYLRELQRKYLVSPDAAILCQILAYYARIKDIPTGDLQAAELIPVKEGPRSRGVPVLETKAGWAYQFNIEQINNLVSLGYPIGAYVEIAVTLPMSTADSDNVSINTEVDHIYGYVIQQIVRLLNERANTGLGYLDTVDNYHVGPGNAEARRLADDGRPVWQNELEIVQEKRKQDPNLETMIRIFSSVTEVNTKKKPEKIRMRVFVPVIALERAYAIGVTEHRQGMSRSTVRLRASSQIDWSVPNQAGALKSAFAGELKQMRFGPSIRKFDYNLLLALSGYFRFREGWLD